MVYREKEKYSFGEEPVDRKTGFKTWKSPMYERQRQIAVDLLESDKFKDVLSENDFWIRKKTASSSEGESYIEYQGLVMGHNAFLKINETLGDDKRFDQRYAQSPEPFSFPGKGENTIYTGYYMTYRDERDGMLEVGEITDDNVGSEYPFAILFKRVFDRVVKRKAGIIGLYSDSEFEDTCKGFEMESFSYPEKTKTCRKQPDTQKEEEPKGCKPEITLEEALEHEVKNSENWAGKKVRDIVEHPNFTEKGKMKILSHLSLKSDDETDKAACSAVLKAVEEGKLNLPGKK